MKNKQFTYVIAPEGCNEYLTPGKKYKVMGDVSYISDNLGFSFYCTSDIRGECYTTSKKSTHLDDKDWIIPEIGQWPDDWTRHQKAKCLQKAGVEILITGAFMQIIGEEQSYEGITTSFSANENQGRTQQQVEGNYRIMSICFYAISVLIVIAAILKGCN